MHARFNPNIYDLTPEGRELLFEAEGDVKFVRPSGHWVHSYMTACATSSIEITARRHGVDFLPAHRILGSAKQDLSISVPTAKGTEHLIPDQLFALDYGGHYRVCALEVDRRTEPVQSTASRKSLARSVAQYAQILDRKSYRAAYGIKSNLIVLWVFASKRSETTFLELLAKRGGPVEQATLTQTVDGFYQHWSPPPLWKHLVTSPWNRAKSSPVRIDRTG